MAKNVHNVNKEVLTMAMHNGNNLRKKYIMIVLLDFCARSMFMGGFGAFDMDNIQ